MLGVVRSGQRALVTLALLPAILAVPYPVAAGTIGFTIRSTVDSHDGLKVVLEIKNTGNEAAFAVRPTVHFRDERAAGSARKEVAPNASHTWTLPILEHEPPTGSHVVLVRLRYEDSNGYPFEVLATAPFAHGAAPKPQVGGALQFPAVRQNSAARGTLKLTFPKARGDRFEVRIALPNGLNSPRTSHSIVPDASRRASIPIDVRNVTLLEGTVVNAFALITSTDEDRPQTDVVQGTIRITAPASTFGAQMFFQLLAALVVYLLALEVISGFRPRLQVPETGDGTFGRLAEAALAAGPSLFLLYHYPWDALLADTITAGGDMASLYYPTKLMAEEILPSGQLTGWTMGNYAGFPVFHFYSTLPFAFIAVLGTVMPMTIAFKLVTLAGPTFLPLAAAYLFRTLGYGRGAPILAAVSVLPFLMQQGNSMWGGNIPSVLAGEYCHAIGITLSLVFFGVLHKTTRGSGSWPLAAALLAAIGLSHTFAFFAAVWYAAFFLWPRKDIARTAPVTLVVFGLTFLLLCFWGLPVPARLVYTSEWSMIWRIKEWTEVLPRPLWPAGILAGTNVLLMLVRIKSFRFDRQGALLFIFAGGILLYFLVPALGFPDIRFIPISQLFLGLIAADLVYWVSGLSRHRIVFATCVLIAGLAWGEQNLGYIPSWLKWNYAGYEGKATWKEFKKINDHVRGDLNDSRVIFEHSQAHNRFGSSRAFENLPLFSGRSTLEGVFHQASQNSPFIFYLQSEASERGSGPFPQYTYTRLDPNKALPHLRLYNVGDLVVVSDAAKKAYEEHPAFERTFQSGSYAVFRVEAGDPGYVVPAANTPVLYHGPEWKLAFYRWYKHPDLIDIPLVPADLISESEAAEFDLQTDAIERLPRKPIEAKCNVESHLEQYRITVETDCPAMPHIVKISYFPRWKPTDSSRLVPVSPGFMLLYPETRHTEILYRRNLVDWVGLLISLSGLALLVAVAARKTWADRCVATISWWLTSVFRVIESHRYVIAAILIMVAVGLATATRLLLRAPDREYTEAQEAYKAREFDKAIRLLEDWTAEDKDTFKQATSLYQLGVSYSEIGNYTAATTVLERLRFQFPNVDYGAGTLFHLARNHARMGALDAARKYAEELEREHSGSSWARRIRTEAPEIFTAGPTPPSPS